MQMNGLREDSSLLKTSRIGNGGKSIFVIHLKGTLTMERTGLDSILLLTHHGVRNPHDSVRQFNPVNWVYIGLPIGRISVESISAYLRSKIFFDTNGVNQIPDSLTNRMHRADEVCGLHLRAITRQLQTWRGSLADQHRNPESLPYGTKRAATQPWSKKE